VWNGKIYIAWIKHTGHAINTMAINYGMVKMILLFNEGMTFVCASSA
jgi:hypothetical protein